MVLFGRGELFEVEVEKEKRLGRMPAISIVVVAFFSPSSLSTAFR